MKNFKQYFESNHDEWKKGSYLSRSNQQLEKELNRLNSMAIKKSGLPNHPNIDAERKKVLRAIQDLRPLRRSEYINLYGYKSWLDYTHSHGIPQNYKWADIGRN
jgi:hypothetical protein